MTTKLTITIPAPCTEDWSRMTPIEKGRHCALCKKSVYDFTTSSDESIIDTFKSNESICGRFNSNQLNRELILSRKLKTNYLSTISSLVFTLFSLTSQNAEAQGQPLIVQEDSIKKYKKEKTLSFKKDHERQITGNIVSFEDKLPVPGVTVRNLRTQMKQQSDFDGNYKIRTKIGDTLEFSFLGLETELIIINYEKNYNLEMKEDLCQYDSFIVAGYSVSNWNGYYKRKCRQKKRKLARTLKVEKIKKGEIRRSFLGRILHTMSYPFRSRE